jgi:hypothetical protein
VSDLTWKLRHTPRIDAQPFCKDVTNQPTESRRNPRLENREAFGTQLRALLIPNTPTQPSYRRLPTPPGSTQFVVPPPMSVSAPLVAENWGLHSTSVPPRFPVTVAP